MAELDLDIDKEFLLEGIIHGFELIPADSPLSPAEMDNYRSSTNPEARDKVEYNLKEEIAEGGALARVQWSKTIKFGERVVVVQIPLPHVPGSIFCPVTAISHSFFSTLSHPPPKSFSGYIPL
eukprot:gene8469-14460_t